MNAKMNISISDGKRITEKFCLQFLHSDDCNHKKRSAFSTFAAKKFFAGLSDHFEIFAAAPESYAVRCENRFCAKVAFAIGLTLMLVLPSTIFLNNY